MSISTHILTKRMTAPFIIPKAVQEISTHILTKRMTEHAYFHYIFLYFNSHPHEEDDWSEAY